MSIAYGFDPNISPIYEDDDDHGPSTYHSVQFSSGDTPKKTGRVHNRTLGTTHLYEQSFHDFHQECAPETSSSRVPTTRLESDEVVEDSTELKSHREEDDDEEVPDSRENVLNDDDEEVPDSTGFLANTFIVLSAGCCLPIRHHLSKSLIEMGAEVQRQVDHRTTHIVVDRYADENVVGAAMSRRPSPPMMVDVKWIQECLDHRQRCEEANFSMTGLRYLRQTCRRLSSFREASSSRRFSSETLEESHWEDMDNDAPQDPGELLEQIRKLSERIDALMNYAPAIRFEYHSPDCPTRQRAPSLPPPCPPPPREPLSKKSLDFRNLLTSISTSSTIKRRRSFTAFCLEHRDPENDVINVQTFNKDVRETWKKPEAPKNTAKSKKATQKTLNDMKKTMAADLTVIRTTLGRNADINRARTPKKTQRVKNSNMATKSPLNRIEIQKQVRTTADDSDIQSALASLTISGPPSEVGGNKNQENSPKESVEILEPKISKRAPLVVTKSRFINRLQAAADDDDDDFISDVSAFLGTRTTKNSKNAENVEIIFTGFSKDSPIEKKLKSIARRFKLRIGNEIDELKTSFVISRHGKRTLMVLKAICCRIPIVRPQWLEESFEDSRLLSSDDYIYDEWREILNNQNSRIFENFRLKMCIAPDCVPGPKDLRWMIEKCGGKVTNSLERSQLIIAPENWSAPDNLDPVIKIVTPCFILDSISSAELQNIREYIVEI